MSLLTELVRHFFGRFFDNEIVSQEGDMRTNLAQAMGLIAVPGMFLSFLLLPAGLRFDRFAQERGILLATSYLFVTYSMVVMGLVMTFEWDALFPDRKDYLILTPLPLPANGIFLGKVVALAIFLALFVLDANIMGTVLFPLVAGGGIPASVMKAQFVAVVAAGVFVALAFASLQGILINVLPANAFRRVSPWVQMAAMSFVILVLFSTPLICAVLVPLLRPGSALVRCFPPFWFLGLYIDLLPGHPGGPLFHQMAGRAVQALGSAAALFAITYLAGYRRHARRVMESVESGFRGPGWIRTRLERAANRWLLPHPLERATFHFISNTILRNPRQRLFLATYAGVALALAAPSILRLGTGRGEPFLVFVPGGLLILPLTLSFFVVTGLRAAFSFPAELRANWIFQVCDSDKSVQHIAASRKWMVLLGLTPMALLLIPFEVYFRGPIAAAIHLSVAILLALILLNALLVWLRKIPFTCSYLPGKTSMAALALFYCVGFFLYSWGMAALERNMIRNPLALLLYYGLAIAALFGLAWLEQRERGIYDFLIYEDRGEPAVRTLELG
jgi:hypothetical protein